MSSYMTGAAMSESIKRSKEHAIFIKKMFLVLAAEIAVICKIFAGLNLAMVIFAAIAASGFVLGETKKKISFKVSPECFIESEGALYCTILIKSTDGSSIALLNQAIYPTFSLEDGSMSFVLPRGEVVSFNQMGMEETDYGWQVTKLVCYKYERMV